MNKQNVCDQEDCPLYGYFINIYKHPKVNELGKLAEKEAKRKPEERQQAVSYLIEMLHIMQGIKTTCLACKHFKRQDMRVELFKDEALDILTKGW